jgi:subtilisin-like proprotein convertase family protein
MKKQFPSRTAMRILCALFVLISTLGASSAPSAQAQAPTQQSGVITDAWAVQVQPGTDPDQLAAQLGAENLGQIGSLTGYYLFRIPGTDSDATAMADVFAASSQVLWFEQQVARQQSKRVPSDPLYPNQWHLADANVQAAWTAGYTGAGVNIAIVDDGLQHISPSFLLGHPDLNTQYVSAGSWDYNGPPGTAYPYIGDNDPSPYASNLDFHGTSAAGVAAANDNNNLNSDSCGVGVAYDAGLSGIRLIGAAAGDAEESAALTFAPNTNSIYSNSWGPFDDAARLEGPGTLTQLALQNGVTNGRGGKGSIYVWAAGNGLQANDNVNYDGYANSRFTIAVGAVDDSGVQASYSEPGAAMLVTAPSSSSGHPGITTTDLADGVGYSPNDCTSDFGGTSSAAPLVSGVVALMLDANPNLGWRDVQNILARTAFQNHSTDGDWIRNNGGTGLLVNHKYGFGLVDAAAAVAMAVDPLYTNLPPATIISSSIKKVGVRIPDAVNSITSTINISKAIDLEHVEVVFNSSEDKNQEPPGTGGYRGDLKVVLTSPSGTESILSESHADEAPDYSNWKFMTVRNWGESSDGTWTLTVTDEKGGGVSVLNSWQLILHGTGVLSHRFVVDGMWTTALNYDEGWRVDMHPRMLGDVNGDGKDDLVGFGYAGVFVGLANPGGNGFETPTIWTTAFNYDEGWRVDMHPRMLGDVNGDGKDDLVGIGYAGVFVALSTGTSFVVDGMWTTALNYDEGWRMNMHPRMLGDVNGDGKDDLVGIGYAGVFVALANSAGHGFEPATIWTNSFTYGAGWRVDRHPRMLGDANGDGKDDLIGFGDAGVYVSLANSTGDGFEPPTMWTTAFNYNEGWRVDMHPRTVGDVNGDGRIDLIGIGYAGAFVALANPAGTGFDVDGMWTVALNYIEGWRVNMHPRMIGDVNGDGSADLVGIGYAGVFVILAQ